MKRTWKKLAVLAVITAIAMVLPGPLTSADDHGRKTIEGKFRFTGEGTCLAAIGGFVDHEQFLLSNPALWSIGVGAEWEGVYTFHRNGTGELNAFGRGVDLPSPALGGTPSVNLGHVYWKFTYAVDDGTITFTYVPGTFMNKTLYGPQQGQTAYLNVLGSWYGHLSPDGKNLSVSWGVPLILQPTADQANTQNLPVEVICNFVQQGFRTEE